MKKIINVVNKMNIQKIKKLIEIFTKSNLTHLEISEGKSLLKMSCLNIKKKEKIDLSDIENNYEIDINKKKEKITNKISNTYILRSPMVGIFYRKPSVNAQPFVEIGQKIKKGDVLCVVEAMKTMNQITSDKSGIIKKILISNGQPVEFDEPLLIIE